MEPIVLASGSLRRHEYFKLMGLPFSIMPPAVDEKNSEGMPPAEFSAFLARRKVDRIIERFKGINPVWIFGADTLIALNGEVIGKSTDRESARETLLRFAGREHEVFTSMALYCGRTGNTDCRTVSTTVHFAPLSERKLEWYLDTGEWQGAAGAYKIQGLGACLIKEIHGSYSNVVGLPLHEFYGMLIENGYVYGEANV